MQIYIYLRAGRRAVRQRGAGNEDFESFSLLDPHFLDSLE